MASETKELKDKSIGAGESDADDGGDIGERSLAKPGYAGPTTPAPRGDTGGRGGGFFTIYKKGQGYWTRMGTAIAVVALAALTSYELYAMRAYFGLGANERRSLAFGLAIGLFVVIMALAWRIMNKPGNVDFLIATDSEMKKVNWTSRKDLIGSTKVVVAFMFFIAFFLAITDVLLAGFFQLIGVLESGGHTLGGG